jgi:DNA-directed RNA polymerase specialized sigma24 family protein
MLCAKKSAGQTANSSTPFATSADFCRIFAEGMNNLYQLAYLLTADHTLAEKCFVSGLEDSTKGNTVFKEWAQSWARRTVIRNAIRILQPRLTDGRVSSFERDYVSRIATEPAEVSRIVGLPAFDRFVFVMSVLERYSDQECSLLLSCTRGQVSAARSRALQQIGKSAQNQVARIESDQAMTGKSETAVYVEAIPQLRASAWRA